MKRSHRSAAVRLALLLLGAAAALSAPGCSQGRDHAGFEASIRRGGQALAAGDLDAADLHIQAAADAARTHEEKRQARSLAQLSGGARAMMAGEVQQARQQWAAIEDPRLNLEVRRQAAAVMDLEVPAAPTPSTESEVR